MREIKFRAWHNIDGWCGAFSVHQTGLIDYGSGWMTTDEANMVLMQYTGLKDKNGKEIYEGDILQAINSDGSKIQHEIIFSDGSFCAKNLKYLNVGKLTQQWISELDFEVIGNIYKDKYLLG